jgi:hypothetical protein
MSANEVGLERKALERAVETLAVQRFKRDGPKGSNAGRWGGVLEGDWDSAIHALIEILLPNRLADDDASATGLDALLEHVLALVEAPGSVPDTLSINYLALMALVRAALAPGARAALLPLAARCFDTLFGADAGVPKLHAIHRRAHGAVANLGDALEELLPELDSLSKESRDSARLVAAKRSQQAIDRAALAERRLLVAKLRAFTLLAAFPLATRSTLPSPSVEKLDTLFARATGPTLAGSGNGDWPPLGFFGGRSSVVNALHFVASRSLAARPFDVAPSSLGELAFDLLLPAPEEVRSLLVSMGAVAQSKDLSAAIGLLSVPRSRLATDKAQAWEDYVLETRGPGGLYCYLPLTTGLAVTALERYAEGKRLARKDELRGDIAESLQALRKDRVHTRGVAHGLPFAQYAVYNAIVVRSLLLLWEKAGRSTQLENVEPAVRYILASQATNGLFQERYAANEKSEGESVSATLRTLANVSRALQVREFARRAGIEPARGRELQREIAYALELAVGGLLELQNSSGGFATFVRTDREKRGLLGLFEGPGAQERTFYDAPAADSTSWVVEGLCALGSRAARERPVPYLELRPARLKDVDSAITRAVGWLRRDFHPDAGWWARYGGGYVSGTAFAVRALRKAGVSRDDPQVSRAVALFVKRQHAPSGGWGQMLEADDPAHNAAPGKVAMIGEVEPELSGLALMALLDAGLPKSHHTLVAAVRYLVDAKRRAGGGYCANGPTHSFMRAWNYRDQLHTDLRPTEALLRWSLAG